MFVMFIQTKRMSLLCQSAQVYSSAEKSDHIENEMQNTTQHTNESHSLRENLERERETKIN